MTIKVYKKCFFNKDSILEERIFDMKEDYSKTFGPNKEMKLKWYHFYTKVKNLICLIWAYLGISNFIYNIEYYMTFFDGALYALIPIAPALLGLIASVIAKVNYKKFSKEIVEIIKKEGNYIPAAYETCISTRNDAVKMKIFRVIFTNTNIINFLPSISNNL